MLNARVEVFRDAVWGVPRGASAGIGSKTDAQAQETFINGVLRVPWHDEKRNPLDWAVSLVVHIVIVAAILIAPLFVTEAINLRDFQNTLLVAPRPPAAAPAPLQPQRVAKVAPHAFQPSKLTAPLAIPARIAIVHDEEPPADLIGVTGGVPGGQTGGALGGILGGVTTSVKPPAPPAATERRILRVGGDVKQPEAISTPPPVYPMIARSARQEGVVIIDAVIDEQGNVVQEQLVEGPPLLVHAALDAVRRWKYQPTYLNGEPVAIRTHIEVHFKLQ